MTVFPEFRVDQDGSFGSLNFRFSGLGLRFSFPIFKRVRSPFCEGFYFPIFAEGCAPPRETARRSCGAWTTVFLELRVDQNGVVRVVEFSVFGPRASVFFPQFLEGAFTIL